MANVAQVMALGEHIGRQESIIKVLQLRFGELSEEISYKLSLAPATEELLENATTRQTLEEFESILEQSSFA